MLDLKNFGYFKHKGSLEGFYKSYSSQSFEIMIFEKTKSITNPKGER